MFGVKIRAWKQRVLMTPRDLADISLSENHVWSLLLHNVICHLTTMEKRF